MNGYGSNGCANGCGPNGCGQLSNGYGLNGCGQLSNGCGHLSNCRGYLNNGGGASVSIAFCFDTYKDTIVHQYSGWRFILISKLDSNYHICTLLCDMPSCLAKVLRSSVVGNAVRLKTSLRILS